MSKTCTVDYFFYGDAATKKDRQIFNENVNLYALQIEKNGLLQILFSHSFFIFLKYKSLINDIKIKGQITILFMHTIWILLLLHIEFQSYKTLN